MNSIFHDLLNMCKKFANPRLGALVATTGLGEELKSVVARGEAAAGLRYYGPVDVAAVKSEHLPIVMSVIISRSCWCEILPMPNDLYDIRTKQGEGHQQAILAVIASHPIGGSLPGLDNSHGHQCAQRFISTAECDCGKADRESEESDKEEALTAVQTLSRLNRLRVAADIIKPCWEDDYTQAAASSINPNFSMLDFAMQLIQENWQEFKERPEILELLKEPIGPAHAADEADKSECQHSPNEDCMICRECEQCREDLDDDDLCPDCGGKVEE